MIRRKRYRIGAKTTKRLKTMLAVFCVACGLALAIKMVSAQAMPVANAIATVEAKNRINKIIVDTVNKTVVGGDFVTADFFSKTEDADGLITSLAVNTVLVNALCADLADDLSAEFMASGSEAILIPSGSLTGIGLFANLGPRYTVKVLPRGNALVDYETHFEAVGINQVNFQVWLDVSVNMRILNPLQPDEIFVERRVPLVNTVFSGKVPENFIGGIPVVPQ